MGAHIKKKNGACQLGLAIVAFGWGMVLGETRAAVEYQTYGSITVDDSSSNLTSTANLDPGSPSPVYLGLSSTDSTQYSMTATFQGGLTWTGPVPLNPGGEFTPEFVSLINLQSAAGPLTFQQNGDLTLDWTTNVVPTSSTRLGIGALSVTGQPQANKVGADVTLTTGTTNASSISVTLDYPVTDLSTIELQPEGLRTAGISGILAVSYGDQSDSDDSAPSGFVTVTVGSLSTISLAESDVQSGDPAILMAGISAAAADGPSKKHDGTNFNNRTVTVNYSGVITNTARAGAGILATATGAQYPNSHATAAVAAPVTVTMTGSAADASTISVTGSTGIGIFAVSDGYPSPKMPHDDFVEGGTVTVSTDQYSSITTGTADSQFSIGILAVSAGTNALIDPYSSQSVNTDGSGNGGAVTVTNGGTITTSGGMAIGIAALSIGGPGISTNAAADSESQLSYLGGGESSDVSGAASNTVTVTNNGTITTLGASAFGIVAISSGGGGLINNAIDNVIDSNGNATAGLAIGNGSNSNNHNPGNPGGAVNVTHSGSISTGDGTGTGAASIGIVAQSIGGNGGSAGGKASLFVGDKGGNGGNGGTVTVTTNAGSTLTTNDVNSVGILAQSIGGGGGNGGNAAGLFVAVGGRGGNGGTGGTVDAYLSGDIQTSADHSGGLIAQSIGGGGGHGGGATSVGAFVDMSIGGKGGSGQHGGTVTGTAYTSSEITTQGNNSAGMHLQSIGGGGGSGGAAYSLAAGAGFSASMSLGGSGAGGGNGGAINGSNAGTITTGVAPTGQTFGQPNLDGADSIGILLQSIGGGGGHGGSAIAHSDSISIPDYPTAGFTLSFGGAGGEGSDGGIIDFTNTGTITTWGDGSHGLLAHSVGGGGGNGGDSTASSTLVAEGVAASDNIAFGGTGSGGGTGGFITLFNGIGVDNPNGAISTHGQNAAAIVAQSIGGGGGNGGLGTAKGITVLSSASTDVTVGLGGSGAGGGGSEGLSVTNFGELATTGSGSQGILAQSIGGGGGNAGGGSSVSNGQTITVSVTVGANGGGGGDASTDEFLIENYASIATQGTDATGILAQSIGGGGGAGGSSDPTASIGSWTFLNDEDDPADADAEPDNPGDPEQIQVSYTATVSLGGNGGGGGLGGSVAASNYAHKLDLDPFVTGSTAQISTQGDRAFGILAQSIGGGGGVGGSATALSNSRYFENEDFDFHATINLSGNGGAASAGGTATLINNGNILTSGYSAHGLFAQSIGGGGGVGADGSIDVRAVIGLGVNVNGESGSGGNGGAVTITQAGKVETSGGDSIGVFAQSIGGGGGVATAGTSTPFFQLGGSVSLLWQTVSVTLGFNPQNNTPTNGGTVTVNAGANASIGENREGGTIRTSGDWSHGIVAQSIGGGGGKAATIYGTTSNFRPDLNLQLGAASGNGNGGAVTANLAPGPQSDGITTTGYSAYGVVLQSIGAGGGLATDGSASNQGTITLGATGTATGDGGAVEITGATQVTTSGENAHAVILQSIGAGGGIAGSGSTLQDSNPGTAASVALGANGATGNGGTITSQGLTVDLTTHGANAFGLVAQSIGGGGGIVTVANSEYATAGTSRLGALGGSSSAASNGGDITLALETGSSITTTGDGAHAIVVQSIGGGGGIANPDAANGLNTYQSSLSGDPMLGSGGAVNVTVDAAIQTSGAGAYGILLQTLAGGGGLQGNFAGTTSDSSYAEQETNGVTTLTQSGSVSATGAHSVGIFAQNLTNPESGASIGLTVNGSVAGATGIWVDGGDQNTIQINSGGSVAAVAGLVVNYSGMAIQTTGTGRTTVTNDGVLSGSLSEVALTNNGTFNAGTRIEGLSTQTSVTNYGVLNPGGTGTTATHTVFADHSTLINGANGILHFDLYSHLDYDTITIDLADDINLASIDGTIHANFAYNPGYGTFSYLLIGPGSIDYLGFDAPGSLDPANVTVSGLDAGSTWTYEIGADHSFTLIVNAVPEPGTGTLLLLGGLAWGIRRLRQRAG